MYKTIIKKMQKFEIEQIDFFEKLPDNVTYPEIYKQILKK